MYKEKSRVRKSEQKRYGKENRLLLKNSKRILIKRASKLKDEQKQRVNAILYISDALGEAYILKEMFYEVCDCTDRASAEAMMEEWIYSAQKSDLKDYHDCANTLLNRQKGILNSFEVTYTNGFTEGCNNKIKVLKRNAYGYRNFERFRKRILHMFRYKSEKAKLMRQPKLPHQFHFILPQLLTKSLKSQVLSYPRKPMSSLFQSLLSPHLS